jgi:hypothetical protein
MCFGSEGCVLVPRSSGTPMATWAWPTWVVSRRRVLEAVFALLEFPSPSRRIFIGSHSLPPLWFVVSVLQILWEGRMIRRQARPCINLIGMYRWLDVVPQGLEVSFLFVLFGDFRSHFLTIFLERFWGLSLWIWWGRYAWTLRGSFPFDSAPKSVSKGAGFRGFLGSRVTWVLGGISSIPLVLASFGGPNLCYGAPMRCSYYLQSLAQIRGAIRLIRSWIWGKLTRGRCSSPSGQAWPVWPMLVTSLTGAEA